LARVLTTEEGDPMYKTSKQEVTEDASGASSGRRAWWVISGELGEAAGGVVGLGVLDANVEAGLHRHRNAEEAMVVLDGSGFALTPGGERPVSQGTFIYAPSGAWHGLRAGDQGIHILMIFGGPSVPGDVDFDPAGEAFDDAAPAASSIEISDVEDIPFHDPSQNFYNISARWLLDADHIGSDAIVVGQSSFAAVNGAHELHRHPGAGEFLYLLSGSGMHVNEDGSEIKLGPGDITFVAPGEWHGFRNRGDETALAIFGYLGAQSLAAGGYELPPNGA
jgi:quercetin dioxygenase-like cupin family protein